MAKEKTARKRKTPKTPSISGEQLLNLDLDEIKRLERERFRRIDIGQLDLPIFRRPCKVKILMLVDTGVSYNQFYFGLSEVLDTLRDNPEWWVNFEVTRAHRQTDPNPPQAGTPAWDLYAPHHENFRFDQPGFDIDDYDQVWFFGFNRGAAGALEEEELAILFRWMDQGGGVFATGDHANLGEALCSRIPRVRNMRKWSLGGPDPAPIATGPDRHDTLRKGHDYAATPTDESEFYTFDDESDDVPMRIRLRWYVHHHCHGGHHHHFHRHWYWPYFWRRSPHPVLCGKDGPIRILPDHPHEGEVVVPENLDEVLGFGDYSAPEYPKLGSAPLAPEIIAWARVQDDHTADSFKGVCNAREFGAIGAYNGHCVNVGRVVVDSTWHHWFDVNLTGRMELFTDTPGNIDETGDPRKLQGFNNTLQGRKALERIRNYYRNVAIWLSPKDRLRCMAARGLWNALRRYPLVADLSVHHPIWVNGHHAIDVLGKYAGQCQVHAWWPLLYPKLDIAKLLDPERIPVPVDPLRMLDEFMLGGMLQEMLEARDSGKYDRKPPTDKMLLKLSASGAKRGLAEMIEHIDQSGKSLQAMRDLLKRGLK